jgi:hypothetical protein
MTSTGTQILVTGADGIIGSPVHDFEPCARSRANQLPVSPDSSTRSLNIAGSAGLVVARHGG